MIRAENDRNWLRRMTENPFSWVNCVLFWIVCALTLVNLSISSSGFWTFDPLPVGGNILTVLEVPRHPPLPEGGFGFDHRLTFLEALTPPSPGDRPLMVDSDSGSESASASSSSSSSSSSSTISSSASSSTSHTRSQPAYHAIYFCLFFK